MYRSISFSATWCFLIFFYLAICHTTEAQIFVGTTYSGGQNGTGTLFKIDATGTFVKLYDMNNTNGEKSLGGLIMANDGLLYGLSSLGGLMNEGSIFNIKTDGTDFTKLHSFQEFDPADGSDAYGSLTQHSNGKLYGMTATGGTNSFGTIFTIDPGGANYQTIYSFNGTNPGANTPTAALVEDVMGLGTLYGITPFGGTDPGAIFSIEPDGTNFTLLKDLEQTDGTYPYCSLMIGSDNKLYGSTFSGGGNNEGTIFRINNDGSGFQVIHHFDATTGSNPFGGLIEKNSKLYGMTRIGGANNIGVVYTCDMNGTNYTVLHEFSSLDGGVPQGALTEASNGFFYGVTSIAGTNNGGTFFSIDIAGNFTKLYDFSTTSGNTPSMIKLFEVSSALPVNWTYFKTLLQNQQVVLEWETASEQGNLGFDVQRSKNGVNWETLAFIKGHNTSSEVNRYSFIDKVPMMGDNYYRLKQFDVDGQVDFSTLEHVEIEKEGAIFLWPNPVLDNHFLLNWNSVYSQKAKVSIVNGTGQVVKHQLLNVLEGHNIFEIPTYELPEGHYIIYFEGEGFQFRETVVINRKK